MTGMTGEAGEAGTVRQQPPHLLALEFRCSQLARAMRRVKVELSFSGAAAAAVGGEEREESTPWIFKPVLSPTYSEGTA